MTQPNVSTTEIDGALGVIPTGSKVLAVVGVSSSGATATPAGYGNKKSLVAGFGVGPLVEMAARAIDLGCVALVCRTGQTTDGAMGTIDDSTVTGTAASFITHTASTKPLDDYQVRVLITTGGTTGTAGIVYQVSFDGGRNYGPKTALGTALIIAPSGTGVSFTITTGKTFVAGDYFSVTTTAPAPNATEVGTALDAIKNSATQWGVAGLAFPIDGTIFDTVETKFAAMSTAGKPRAYVGGFRIPTDSESESTYKTAFETAFSTRATTYGSICVGAAQIASAVSGRAYRRAWAFHVAPLTASVEEHIDVADVNLGAASGVSLVDANGNNVYHDESINPGLDDDRACVARSWDGDIQGTYVNRPRLLCADGSDFTIMPMRRVMNLARIAMRAYLIRRLNRPVRVDKKTGFILEAEAREIEAGGNAVLKAVLGGSPKASGWSCVVHRDDNLLSTKTMHVDTRIIPLAYVETIVETEGFTNPALQTITG